MLSKMGMNAKFARPTVDEYFLKMSLLVAERSTCLRHHVGAIAVRDRHVLTTGYNGAPSGLLSCIDQEFCVRARLNIPSGERTEVCRAVHAEENVIIQGSLHQVSLAGATIYCTHSPCRRCAKMLCNATISKFVTFGKYDDTEFCGLFRDAGVEFVVASRPDSVITELG